MGPLSLYTTIPQSPNGHPTVPPMQQPIYIDYGGVPTLVFAMPVDPAVQFYPTPPPAQYMPSPTLPTNGSMGPSFIYPAVSPPTPPLSGSLTGPGVNGQHFFASQVEIISAQPQLAVGIEMWPTSGAKRLLFLRAIGLFLNNIKAEKGHFTSFWRLIYWIIPNCWKAGPVAH